MDVIRGDVLTDSRVKRKDVTITEGKRGGISFEATQVPIDHYLKRRIISLSEYRAANRLFTDFSLSGQVPGMTANLNPHKGGLRDFTHAQMEARERWRQAMEAVAGTVRRLILLNVCCYGYWLKEINHVGMVGINRRGECFREALAALQVHYDAKKSSRSRE